MQRLLIALLILIIFANTVSAQDTDADTNADANADTDANANANANTDSQNLPELVPFTQAVVTLDSENRLAAYAINAEAGSVWSFSAVSDELDPVLRILAPGGEELAANDNESRRSTDARIENWTAPIDGIYRLQVEPFGRNIEPGSVVLTAVNDENSVVLSPMPRPESVTLASDEAYPLIESFNLQQIPIKIQYSVSFTPGEGYLLRFDERWQVIFNSDMILLQRLSDAGDFIRVRDVLRERKPHPSGDYTLLLYTDRLEIYGAGRAVLLAPSDMRILPGVANIQLEALEANQDDVIFEHPYASAHFYGDSIPPYEAMPPVDINNRLFAPEDLPILAVDELRNRQYIHGEGGIAFSVPDAIIETSKLGFSTLPLDMAIGFEDFVLHFAAVARHGSPSTACGMSIHRSDGSDFTSVLFSADGSAFLLPYANGELAEEHLALQTAWVNQGVGERNSVILAVQDSNATLFINGILIETINLETRSGVMDFTVVLSDEVFTRCTYDSIWVWSLDTVE